MIRRSGLSLVRKLKGEMVYDSSKSYFLTQAMFEMLCEHPYGLPSVEIGERLYALRDDGGPLTMRSIIRQLAHHFNFYARKEKVGLRMRATNFGGPGRRYQIWVVKEAA